jgi:nitrite reductase/ring-hydroxylating ferredoxin subunit
LANPSLELKHDSTGRFAEPSGVQSDWRENLRSYYTKGIECWLHGSCFDLETGKPSSLPATDPVDVYAVDIRDGDVFVDVTVTTN